MKNYRVVIDLQKEVFGNYKLINRTFFQRKFINMKVGFPVCRKAEMGNFFKAENGNLRFFKAEIGNQT